jgi:uncharacterized integral membrane protein
MAVAFLIVFYGFYNPTPIEIKLGTYRTISIPLSFLVLYVFVAGVFFLGIITISDRFQLLRTIKKLKKQTEKLTEIIQKQEETINTYSKQEQIETSQLPERELANSKEILDQDTVKRPKKADEIKLNAKSEKEKHSIKELPDNDEPNLSVEDMSTFKEPEIEDESEADVVPAKAQVAGIKHPKNDKFSLSAEEREIALRRIQNG